MIPLRRRYPFRGFADPCELLREGHGVMSVRTPDLGWRHFAVDAVDRDGLLKAIEERGWQNGSQ